MISKIILTVEGVFNGNESEEVMEEERENNRLIKSVMQNIKCCD